MAVSTEHTKDILMGDGFNTKFPFTFQVIDKKQIRCLKVLASGEEIELLNTEFEVSLSNEGANGGEINYPLIGSVLEEECKFIIYRQTEIKQDFTPPNGQIFDAVAVKNEIDRLTMQNQEQEESIERTVKTSMGSNAKPEEYLDNVNEMLNNARVLQERAVADCEQNIAAVQGEVAKAANSALEARQSETITAEKAQIASDIVGGFNAHALEKQGEFDANSAEKTLEYNQNHDATLEIVQNAVDQSLENADRAEYWANNAEVQAQSVYQDKIALDSSVIILQERKCRYVRNVASGDDFSIDKSAIKQTDKDITFELILKMSTVVAFSFAAITSTWMGGDAPDLSEAGEHWFAFTSQDVGVTWRGSYEGKFA